jgi:hypothetical protein
MARARDGDAGSRKADSKAEKATAWLGVVTAVAGLLAKTQKFETSSTNAICVVMFAFLLIYVLHDIYDALWQQYAGYGYAIAFSAFALVCLLFWFAGYWLQRTLGPLHPEPLLDEKGAYWLILPPAVILFVYALYDLGDAYHYEYEGYEETIQAAIASLVVIIVLGFLSYPSQ